MVLFTHNIPMVAFACHDLHLELVSCAYHIHLRIIHELGELVTEPLDYSIRVLKHV